MVQKVSLILQCEKISKPDILVDSRQLFIIKFFQVVLALSIFTLDWGETLEN